MARAANISSILLVSLSSNTDPNSFVRSNLWSVMLKRGSDTNMLWACVWERVMGLVRGKAAGSVFLGLPMVSVIVGYSRYPCLPSNYKS
jgi:hypothetical protein